MFSILAARMARREAAPRAAARASRRSLTCGLPSDLSRLYDYYYWANSKLFDVIAQLKAEQFTQKVSGSYGSIRNSLVHVLSAEWGWLDRCGGHARGPKPRCR